MFYYCIKWLDYRYMLKNWFKITTHAHTHTDTHNTHIHTHTWLVWWHIWIDLQPVFCFSSWEKVLRNKIVFIKQNAVAGESDLTRMRVKTGDNLKCSWKYNDTSVTHQMRMTWDICIYLMLTWESWCWRSVRLLLIFKRVFEFQDLLWMLFKSSRLAIILK